MFRIIRGGWPVILAAVLLAPACTGSSGPDELPPPPPTVPGAAVATADTVPRAPADAPATGLKRLGSPTGNAFTPPDSAFEPLPGATAVHGMLGKAAYRIEMPAAWNGELILWAHGFAGFGPQLILDNPPAALRQAWVDGGYAWAASSYSENGYVPGIGADDTLALKRYFEQEYGQPKRTYLVGASMGGNVAALALEAQAGEYDGALAMCGALGGEEQLDYLASWPLVAEFVAGVKLPLDDGNTQALLPALLSLSPKLGEPLQPTPAGQQFISVIRELSGGPRPFFLEGLRQQWQANFAFVLVDPARKTLPFAAVTNVGVQYRIDPGLGLTEEALNAGVRRLAADPAARNAAAHPDAVPTTGKLGKPMLTLHNTGDLFVPISNEQSYRAKADAAGVGGLLVQRAVRAAGHCQFSDEERLTAWQDLVAWVRDGKKPAGDDLSGDLSDIGRAFTNPVRPGDPGTKE